MEAEVLPRDDHEQGPHHDRRVAQPVLDERAEPHRPACAESTNAPGWRSSRNTIPVTASDSTYGRKNRSRNTARPGKRRLSITASASENGIWTASDRTMTKRLLPTAVVEGVAAERDLVVLEADEVGERREAVPLVQAVVGAPG